jgi:putative membrane protein
VIGSNLEDPWVILRSWTLDPLVIAGVGVSLWMYLRAVGRLRPAFWPRPRTWYFVAGNAVLVLALVSPIDVYGGRLLSVHMVQHLLLTMVAPPLLLLSAPITLALRAARPSDRAVMVKILRSRTARFLSKPLLGWFLFLGVLWATHLPAFYDATLQHLWLHAAEHLAYLVTALMFWRPMVGTDPSPTRLSHPARILWLFLAMPQMTFLGLAIYGSDRVLYAPYVASSALLGTSAIADQHLAGAIMWASAMLFMVPAMAVVMWDWMNADEKEAARIDARLERTAAARGA